MNFPPRASLVLAILLAVPAAFAAEGTIEIPLWTGAAPGSEGEHPAEQWQERGKNGVIDRAVRQINAPTITVFLPAAAQATHVALLIAPGGGYEHVTFDKEGTDVARWLVSQRIAGFVLKYRLPRTPGTSYTVDTSLADAVQALKVIRAHASEWSLDPAKVGMIGFSAGGNLAALAGTRPPKEERPSFLALMYPVVAADFGEVPADLAPTFIVQANDDMLGTENALRFYQWARAKKVSAELHLLAKGGHGFGLGKSGTATGEWPNLLRMWLATAGILPLR
jgi:acetyl esterase/lipase